MLKTTIQEMNRLTPEAFQLVEKVPLIVVLDNVRSQHNIGAVFRTADAFCLQGVYLCGICCCPPNNEIHKTALGAENTVDWKYFQQTADAVKFLQSSGYTIYAIEQAHGSTPLDQLQLHKNQKIAIVMGHEVFGVQQEIVDIADGCIEIPQYGTKHSLNVSVTAGIVMYELSNMLR
jgi:tRNA G18 (ribose-2'-O)-methylase SpoU